MAHKTPSTAVVRAARAIGFSLVVSLVMTVCSVAVQSYGPEEGIVGERCGPRADENCMAPLLNGGFPWRYLFDFPAISVPNRLTFVEDRFVLRPFLMDWGLYFALVLLVLWVLRHTFGCPEKEAPR